MRLAPYIPLSGCIVNVLFAVFVFTRAPKLPANRVYLLLTLTISVWNFGCYQLLLPHSADEALIWARLVLMACIFGVAAFFHLAMLVAGFRVGFWIWILYGFEILLALTNCTDLFVRDVQYLGSSGWYAVAGPAFYVFMLPFSLMFGSIFVLLRRRRELPRFQRRRLTPLIVAQSLLSVLGANDILPIAGITYYPFTSVQVYPWGSLAAVFYGVITAYSVMQHQLLDIKVTLSRYAAHLIRIAFLVSITVGLLLVAAAITGDFTPLSFGSAICVFTVAALVASFFFPRLFGGNAIEAFEHRLLGDHFEYQDRVREFIKSMVWYSDVDTLLYGLHDLLANVFRFERYWVILRDETQRSFVIARGHPEQRLSQAPQLDAKSPIALYFLDEKSPSYLALREDRIHLGRRSLERAACAHLEPFLAELAFPLVAESDIFGLVLVGAKPDSEPITSSDLRLLIELTKQLSLVANQIRLKDEVLRTQELELLGRMSRGMAHDLNNLLTPIWTLLQLAKEGLTKEAFDHELLDVAFRNIRTVRAYIREALFFSQHLRLDLELSRINIVIEHAVELARTNRKKEVEIMANTRCEVLVEMDEVLMQRLLANLISNAVDAAPVNSQITVDLQRMGIGEGLDDWVRIRVIDEGEGIPKENLERVLAPYFTTKNRGDGARGFGLGLAICRKIVALHGGKLAISSELRKGTTVQIDLPSRQMQVPNTQVAHAA